MKQYSASNVQLKQVAHPGYETYLIPEVITDETIQTRKENVLKRMRERELDCLCIYADLEHGSNFEYLTGFLPRFEEALLVLFKEGNASMVLGNENLKMAAHSRIPVRSVHTPYFSLPNQPMDGCKPMNLVMEQAGIKTGMKLGIVGWKLFTGTEQNRNMFFDLPHFLLEAIKEAVGLDGTLYNATDLLIHPQYGARIINNANEIIHYGFGSALSGDCVLRAMDLMKAGMTEMEVASSLKAYGQPNTVVTICSSGTRFINANMYPSFRTLSIGDRVSITTGFKGGLASRAGYGVSCDTELPERERNYVNTVASPYFAATAAWLEKIHIGMKGGELYKLMEHILPKEMYHWKLNPGHLTADEEWLASPVYPESDLLLQSGMLLQLDIIPSVPGFGGASAESGIALADEALQENLKRQYPEFWKNIMRRRAYMKEVLNIEVGKDVLPLSNITGYYRPYFYAKDMAFVMGNSEDFDR